MTTRRNFLGSSLATALGTAWHPRTTELINRGLLASPPRRILRAGEPDLKALAHRALDAATAAGASYADVRFTVTRERTLSGAAPASVSMAPSSEAETVAMGVRALVQGAWGFASDVELTADMAAWLGSTAARSAKAGAWPNCPPVELGPRPPAAVGTWQMPVKRDPLTVPDAEYKEYFNALAEAANEARGNSFVHFQVNFARQDRTFASTEGAFTTQTVYQTFKDSRNESPYLYVATIVMGAIPIVAKYSPPVLSPSGFGYEVFEERRIRERIPEWIDRALDGLVAKPLDSPGRYDVVFDGFTMAGLVNTLGAALEADRVLGHQAASDGTSYLSPIQKMLGTSLLPRAATITADRSQHGGVATVKWDDEGVASQDYTLVKDGKLIDYETSREFVPEMAAWYRTQGQPVGSRGCAMAESALAPPLVRTPNLRLHPGPQDASFESLLAGIDDGFAFLGGEVRPDHQQLTVIGDGNTVYKIKKGKLAGMVEDARFLARMPQLWQNLVALGGEQSAQTRGFMPSKGEPGQYGGHSVRAVAARFRNVPVISAEK